MKNKNEAGYGYGRQEKGAIHLFLCVNEERREFFPFTPFTPTINGTSAVSCHLRLEELLVLQGGEIPYGRDKLASEYTSGECDASTTHLSLTGLRYERAE